MKKPKLIISFGRSTSPSFPKALKIAEKLSGHKTAGEGRKQTHTVTWLIDLNNTKQWNQVRELISLVRGWRSSDSRVEGLYVEHPSRLDFEVGRIFECKAARDHSLLEDDYCVGKSSPTDDRRHFACRMERGVDFSLGVDRSYHFSTRGSPYWYEFGSLSTDNTRFEVDRKKIKSVLYKHLGAQICHLCPAFSWSRLDEGVSTLPNSIELGQLSQFELRYSSRDLDVVLGIKPRYDRLSMRVVLGVDQEGRGQSTGRSSERHVPDTRYCDVAGQDEAISQVRDVVEFPLRHAEYFDELGMRPHRGVLLYGPPGNGKTLLAKAVAGETSAHLEIINGPEVLSKWVGESERHLREIFSRARALSPSIVLIDEIDAIAPSRDAMSQHHEVQLISQLLVLLDGLEESGVVVVLGTTNRLSSLDSAIMRPGRFDYHVHIKTPDELGRSAILRAHASKMKVSDGVDYAKIAKLTEGLSGAELAAVVREAGLAAIQKAIATCSPKEAVRIDDEDLQRAVLSIREKRRASS